jgi:transposase InsO family protein
MSPHEMWLTKLEAAEITGCHKRSIERYARANRLRTKPSDKKAENGKRERLYAASSLPAAFQPKLLEYCIRRAAAEHGVEPGALVPITDLDKPSVDPAQRSLFTASPSSVPVTARELPGLSEEQFRSASGRLEAVQRINEWREDPKPFSTQDGRKVRSLDELVAYLADINHVHRRTVWKWDSKYNHGGETPQQKFVALADRARKDRGIKRAIVRYPKLVEYILIKFLGMAPSKYLEAARVLHLATPPDQRLDSSLSDYKSERLPITAVYAGIEKRWPDWYGPAAKRPCYNSVRNFLKSLPDDLKTLAFEGGQAFAVKCDRRIKRAYDMPVNCWWSSDHRILDIFGANNHFPGAVHPRGAWLRMYLTTIFDVRSRRVLGWAWSKNPSWRSIAGAARMAMMKYGPPRSPDGSPGHLYIDNGEDYKLFARTIAAHFGLHIHHAIPYSAWSKSIESWHSILSEHFDQSFGPSYAGRDAKARSPENTMALKMHEQWRAGKLEYTPLPPLTYIMQMFAAWVELEYNAGKHHGEGMLELPPQAVFEREYPPEKWRPLDIAEMAPLFWQRVSRRVENGKIQFDGREYEGVDTENDFALRLYNKRDVEIAANPDDQAYALAYEPAAKDQPFIARLHVKKLLPYGPIAEETIKAVKKDNARYRRGYSQFLATLRQRAVVSGVSSKLDDLAARAGIAMPMPMPYSEFLQSMGDSPVPAAEAGQAAVSPLRLAAAGGSARPRNAEDFAESFLEETN